MNLFGGTSNLSLKVVKKDLLTKLVMICDFLGLSLDENTVERGVVFLTSSIRIKYTHQQSN